MPLNPDAAIESVDLNAAKVSKNSGKVKSGESDHSIKMNRKRTRSTMGTDRHLLASPHEASKFLQIPPPSIQIPSDSSEAFTKYCPPSPSTSVVSCDDQVSTGKKNKLLTKNNHDDDMEGYTSTNFLQLHKFSLGIEAKLAPFKPLLSKMMVHPKHNRKGTFNVPVDHVKLGLKDYSTIVKTPMDLGTVKVKLLSNLYLDDELFANDVRLVFKNAIAYNPPSHPVHEAAKGLLSVFEDGYASIKAKKVSLTSAGGGIARKGELLPTLCQPIQTHTCKSCLGRVCDLCNQGCLTLESSLLICSGAMCAGTKIRKGATYFCSLDGTRTWCQRCYGNLPTILPSDEVHPLGGQAEHKRTLLKRRNEEDVVERWVNCSNCSKAVHEICAFSNEFSSNTDQFICPSCSMNDQPFQSMNIVPFDSNELPTVYSFFSGKEIPQAMKHVTKNTFFDAGSLPKCPLACFLEKKIQSRMRKLNCPGNAEKTLSIRVISNSDRSFHVPDVVRRHFRSMKEKNVVQNGIGEFEAPPSDVHYKSKAIALFQRVDGMDICLFCMYVQEYDNPLKIEDKMVYIAYIDSVEHFRPRNLRTNVFHEILVAYLATARVRGFQYAHIWSCPPTRGNSFVFWVHPFSQKNPTKDRLLDWYHRGLSLAIDYGIVTNVKSLYEFSFQRHHEICKEHPHKSGGLMLCPPLLDGDFWVEEAQRINSNIILKAPKGKHVSSGKGEEKPHGIESRCPAMHLLEVLEDEIMSNPDAAPFSHPVNAAALGLNDYHDIIKKPMDLGTIHSKLLRGEYDTFRGVVEDLELVFNNAMLYNPKGHMINKMAESMRAVTKKSLGSVIRRWYAMGVRPVQGSSTNVLKFKDFADVSMRLGAFIRNNIVNVIPCERQLPEEKETVVPNLISGGMDAVAHSMVGDDTWMLERRELVNKKKKKQVKKRPRDEPGKNESTSKKRKECWLADELSSTVKQLRTDFFVCYLKESESMSKEEQEKNDSFIEYISEFQEFELKEEGNTEPEKLPSKVKPAIADTRHGLLEFSQYRNFQFDTIRRAKYSTAMLIRYLLHPDSPGLIPICTKCKKDISSVRWHKINKAFDERRRNSVTTSIRMTCVDMGREDLCKECFDHANQKENYVPIRVSFEREDFRGAVE